MKPGVRVMTLQCSGWGNSIGEFHHYGKRGVVGITVEGCAPTACFYPKEVAELPKYLPFSVWDAMTGEEQRAFVERRGIQVCCSTGLGDETTYGFGYLDPNGYWEHPCYWYQLPSPCKAVSPSSQSERTAPNNG